MSELSTWIPIAISILALTVSVIAIVDSRRASSRSNNLQERLLRVENTREHDRRTAGLRANIVAFVTTSMTDQRLYFRNEGQATARNIEVLVDGHPLKSYQYVVAPDRAITTLGPKAEASVVVANVFGGPDGIHVRATWEDDSGSPGRWESDLSL